MLSTSAKRSIYRKLTLECSYCPLILVYRLDNAHIRQQDDVHHQGVYNGWYGHHVVGKDKWTAGNRDGLGSILHTYFYNNSTLFTTRQS